MSGDIIKFGCWKEEDSTFDLTADDLVCSGTGPPVDITKRQYKNTYNRIEVEYIDRDNSYLPTAVIANEEVDQRISGVIRLNRVQLHGFNSASVAQKMAQRLLAEAMYRYSYYKFSLSYKNMTLHVGKVGTISDGFSLVSHKIRILKIQEATDGSKLDVEAIEDKPFIYMDTAFESAANLHTSPAAITLVSPAIYFTENRLDASVNLHLVAGAEETNGWLIYVSWDDSTFDYIGVCHEDFVAPNCAGAIVSSLNSWPAVIHRANESVCISGIALFTDLQTVSHDLFFDNTNLAKIGDEVIGFRTASGPVGGVWTISDLMRGLFNTKAEAHSPGEVFHTLKSNFKYTFSEFDIGRTIYVKALSFYGEKVQQLEDVSSESYTILGEFLRPAPVSLMRINGRNGFTDYAIDDPTVNFHLASKRQGFNLGGFDTILWGAYDRDSNLTSLEVVLKEIDDTEILSQAFALDLSLYPEVAVKVYLADRGGKDPVKVDVTPGGIYASQVTRQIIIDDSRI